MLDRVTPKEVTDYAFMLGASHAVVPPPGWNIDHAARPYPTEQDMRAGAIPAHVDMKEDATDAAAASTSDQASEKGASTPERS